MQRDFPAVPTADAPAPDQLEPVPTPPAWDGSVIEDDAWIWRPTVEEITEVDNAVAHAKATKKSILDMEKEDFPMPSMEKKLANMVQSLEQGHGFCLIRGFPMEGYSLEDIKLRFWAFGQHLGYLSPQNNMGHLIGDVRDNRDQLPPEQVAERAYNSNRYLGYHCDTTDIVALLCIRPAKKGGTSTIMSSPMLYNIMLEERPDLLPELFKPFPFGYPVNEIPAGHPGYYTSPIFSICNGVLSCHLIPDVIREGIEIWKKYGKELSDKQQEAFRYLEDLTENRTDLRLDMNFQPGDMQFLNNHTVLHARTDFVDHPELEKRRHLLRIWVTLREGGRELAPGFAEFDPSPANGILRGWRWPKYAMSVPGVS